MEWGCMQALIDFDGWRKWKDFSQNGISADDAPGATGGKKILASSKKKKRQSMGSQNGAAAGSTTHLSIKEEDEKDAT